MREFNEELQAAVHEAGHATLGVLYFPEAIQFASLRVDGMRGGVGLSFDERYVLTRERFKQLQAVILAGRVAEMNKFDTWDRVGGNNDSLTFHHLHREYCKVDKKFHVGRVRLQYQAIQRARKALITEQYLFERIIVELFLDKRLSRERLLALRDEFSSLRPP